MYPRAVIRICLWAVGVGVCSDAAPGGTVTGRREGQFGGGIHESWVWLVGVGANAPDQWGVGMTWGGDFTIENVPAGSYRAASGDYGEYRLNIGPLISVPASGTVDLQLRDRNTMSSQGTTDLGECLWAAQEFVATGTSVDRVMFLSPSGGTQVRIAIRGGGPQGSEIGPAQVKVNGSLFPGFASWRPGEVPLVPGRRYALRLDRVSSSPWRPAISYRVNEYPNGGAWIDGLYHPEVDLRVAVTCRDDGITDDYDVSNWWRSNTFSELVQTFVPSGAEMRIARMMLAGQEGHVMRASVHGWNGSYPPGSQIGPAKYMRMGANLDHGFVWGPGEAPLTPGQRVAIRFVRADGQPFAIYGDADDDAQGQAYFDGIPDGGIDITGQFTTSEPDLGDIVVSNASFTPVSATEVRATFDTDVPTTATVAYQTGLPVFETIEPADGEVKTSHEVIVRHLRPGTSYQMRILAYHPSRNVFRGAAATVTMPLTAAALSGHVHSQVGAVQGARIIIEKAGLSTLTDGLGDFTIVNVPTGRHTLRVEAVACGTLVRDVDVTPDGLARADVVVDAYSNLLAGTDDNPIAGWTEFDTFDGQWNSGDWSVYARTGPKWVGSVTNGSGGKKGGIYRKVPTEPGKRYTFAGWVQTRAFGSAEHDPIPGLSVARIGVDVTGGTDPTSSAVIWGRYRFTDGAWKEVGVSFTGTGAEATLFAQHKYETYYLLAPWWIAGFDDLWVGYRLTTIPDFDHDDDVDLDDFGHLQACYSGSGYPQEDVRCADALLDDDDDIDTTDLAVFLTCMSGANVPYDPACGGSH